MNPCLRQTVSLGYIIAAAFFFTVAVIIPETVLADNLTLYTNYYYNLGTLKTTDQAGTETKTNIENLNQLYNIYIDKNIFPHLVFDAGGLFGRNNSAISTGGTDLHSAENLFNLFTDLKLNAKPFSSSIGYSKRTDTSTAQGTSFSNIDERYNALFDYKPEEGLPSFDLNYTKDFIHDGRRIFNDTSVDQLLLNLRYDPTRHLSLIYNYDYLDSFDNLRNSETTQTTHSGRITYDDSYFNNRANIAATYDISDQINESITGAGAGSVTQRVQLFPVHGLSGISDLNNPLQTPLMITLTEDTALIDGNLTASAGINLGLNSGLVTIPAPPRQEWNIGADFINPTQVNTLFIWVDKDLTKISDLFKWDIFVSSDNVTWTKEPFTVTVSASNFSTLPLPHFIINFPSAITSRFVKVVVKPLDSTDQATILVRGLVPANFSNIAVTELQAFQSQTVSSGSSRSTSESFLSQRLNLNARAKIFEKQNLFYDLSLFLSRSDPGAITTAFLSNGLSYNQKFGGIFAFNSRVARDDSYLTNGHGVAYQYSAALGATPLATLQDALLYSGQYLTDPTGKSSVQNTVLLQNTAILYPGINAFLNGGYSFGTLTTGQSSDSLQASTGLTLVPNTRMTLNLSYSLTNSSVSAAANLPATSNTFYTAVVSATYTPVNALYLFGSAQFNSVNSVLRITKNYGVNFSPFAGGQLQFTFSYNETLGPEPGEESRLITPSLRWNIRPGATLDVTYQIQHSKLTAQTSDSTILSSSLQISL